MLTVGLSQRRHFPVLRKWDWTFSPWQIRKSLNTLKRMKHIDLRRDGQFYRAKFFGADLLLDRYHAVCLLNEYDLWPRFYTSTGKKIMDVGAGNGETCAFYFSRGASRITAIESDPNAYALLLENARRNDWNVQAINEPFNLAHLSLEHDFLKMDIEGGEKSLLELREIDRCAMEIHGRELISQFRSKFPELRIVKQDNPDLCIAVKT